MELSKDLDERIRKELTQLDNSTLINPLTFENGLYYWNSCGSSYGRVKNDFGNVLPEIKNGIILDVGCSYGKTTLEISDLYPTSKLVGIDRVIDLIGQARENAPQCDFLVADAYNLPFAKESFDGIFCMNNLWYLISNKRKRVSKQDFLRISELVKQGGYLFFSGNDTGIIFRKDKRIQLWNAKQFDLNNPSIGFLFETFNQDLESICP